ncbi:MAG TPA: anti-sigma factor [Bryobacteraceae bacterium]|jgi:hypothetical protein|nr:anti-sigma factor [Bryobacteraceae bacterium]
MNCSELKDDYELYAMGIADDPERSEIAEHLRTGCPNCTAGLRAARSFNAAMLQSLPLEQPSRLLRERVVNMVGGDSLRRVRRVAILGSLAYATAALLLLMALRSKDTELRDTRAQLARSNMETQRVQDALSILNAPETKAVTFSPGPRGRVFVNPSRGVLLIASNLPRVPEGKAYELWVIPKGGNPKPAGLFNSDTAGNVMYHSPGAVDLASTGAVAVSVEPESGSPQPTTTPVLVVPVAE